MNVLRVPAPAAVLQKEFLAHAGARVCPVYLVNEYPKSGGTWLKFMLADALDLPVWTRGKPAWGPCVMQAHWLRPRKHCKTVGLFRDGRDVMVSFYYHCFFQNEFRNGPLVETMRQRFAFNDLEDIRSNLLPFMQQVLEAPISPSFSWKAFVNTWANRPGVVICRYEDLRLDTSSELIRLARELSGRNLSVREAESIAERYSMQNMRENKEKLHPRMTGHQEPEISFVRKGKVGGWSESFTDEALAWFEKVHKQELSMLGYRLGRPVK